MYTAGNFHADANMASVIAMQRMKIPVLPSIVNAALITTVVSGGNAFAFNASRSLHALALEGQAPAFLRRTNSKYVDVLYRRRVSSKDGHLSLLKHRGVPYLTVIVVMSLGCLAYLALGSGSAKVLGWILK